jgi:uncharacterized protein (TIGR02391 family)
MPEKMLEKHEALEAEERLVVKATGKALERVGGEITRAAAAKGTVRSGGTLRALVRALVEQLESAASRLIAAHVKAGTSDAREIATRVFSKLDPISNDFLESHPKLIAGAMQIPFESLLPEVKQFFDSLTDRATVALAEFQGRERKLPMESYSAENRAEPDGHAPGPGWESLLHPTIRASALAQYRDGHWRDAVLNAFIAVFDLVRSRTGLDLDGDRLATRVFSADKPLLVVADLSTESGRDDQVGFMMVMQGVFRGIRNPKAHSLQHDLNALKSAQYLVMASLLARRVGEAQLRADCGPP